MESFLGKNKPFPWKKKGPLFSPSSEFSNEEGIGYSHASHPCAIPYKDDLFIIAFTRRDSTQRSHIFLSHAKVVNGSITLLGEPKLALCPGDMGYFDVDGVISCCFIEHQGTVYLYYVGWQNLPHNLWICDTGRAILDPEALTLTREFLGPVFGRDKNNPLFAAATAFHISDNLWQTWYNSGIKWEKTPQGWHHYYGIHYAESSNGIDWTCHPGLSIPFRDEYEYAFGRPTVFVEKSTYFMWFACRATPDIPTYRIGFASSKDGRNWQRNDALSGIDVSPQGWDSEMICYPCVFKHKDTFYMLYNGNGYGKTGFGFAVMEK